MNRVAPLNRDLIRGEVRSRIHWGAEEQEVIDLLQTQYGISGAEAEAMIAEGFTARAREIRKKALLLLIFGVVGLAITAVYFGIKSFKGSFQIGGGSSLFGTLGTISILAVVRSLKRMYSGETSGSV